MSAQHHPEHKRMTIDIPSNVHKKLKAIAAYEGISLKNLIITCLKDNLLSSNIPNEETLKVFRETEEGKNLIRCENFDDFIKKLNLQ